MLQFIISHYANFIEIQHAYWSTVLRVECIGIFLSRDYKNPLLNSVGKNSYVSKLLIMKLPGVKLDEQISSVS